MNKYKTLEEVASYLGDGQNLTPDITFNNNEELVNALVVLGSTDKVFARHDDHLGLKDELSSEFLRGEVDDPDDFDDEREVVLEQANIIISLYEKNLSEEDIDDIREEAEGRGVDPDDLDI